MPHLIVTLGTLVAAAAVLAVVFRRLHQSSIVAFVAVGLIAANLGDAVHLPEEIVDIFTELGILLLLFMAGLEVDARSLVKHWRLVLKHGVGQIVATAALGMIIGKLLLPDIGWTETAFLGLCLTFSSTIVVISFLKNHRQMETLHGQVILGLMVMQDVTAVGALVVLRSLGGGGSLAMSLAGVGLKLVAAVIVMLLMAKFVVRPVFRYLATSNELLFVGSLGYALGSAALCEVLHFSPEIGVFLAGMSLCSLPYRLEVQDKVEPMKDFGVILFFLALGYRLELGRDSLSVFGPVAIIVLFTVVGTPLLMAAIAYWGRLRSRPAFMIGAIINQISEFSLILATLCLQQGVFSERTFTVVTLSAVGTILISSLGHQFLDGLYKLVRPGLAFIERHSDKAEIEPEWQEDHVVVLSYNELATQVVEHFTAEGKHVLLVDVDPEVYDRLSGTNENLRCMYADIFDPDTWVEAGFLNAALIVSCWTSGNFAELGILRWLKDHQAEVRDGCLPPLVAATNAHAEAHELYEAGAMFVMQVDDLAARQLRGLLREEQDGYEGIAAAGKRHHDDLERMRREKPHTFANQ